AAQRAARAVACRPRGHRVDQLADAVHDEGDLRAVPVQAPGPADGQGELRVLLLRSGPADGSDGLGKSEDAPARELAAGKAVGAVAGVLPGEDRAAESLTLPWSYASATCWPCRFAFTSPPCPSLNTTMARLQGPADRVVGCASTARLTSVKMASQALQT